jgi:hypothetical protein
MPMPGARSMSRATSACAPSTLRRTTVSASRNGGLEPRSPRVGATPSSSRRRSAACSSAFSAPGAPRARSARHRLHARPRRALGGGARHGLSRTRGAAHGGHRRCHRSGHEPVEDARRPRAGDRHRRGDARRSLYAPRAGRVGTTCSPCVARGASRWLRPASSTAVCSPERTRAATPGTTTAMHLENSSSGRTRSPASAAGTAQRCPRLPWRFHSPTRRLQACASGPGLQHR